jgi:farnesyl-diphosphate farnesyltransferase
VKPLLDDLLGSALDHYDAAWSYTLAIPRLEWRMRLACVWPLMIGLETLAALAEDPDPLARPTPIKASRRTVRGVLARSALSVWSNRALAADARRVGRRLDRLRARTPAGTPRT